MPRFITEALPALCNIFLKVSFLLTANYFLFSNTFPHFPVARQFIDISLTFFLPQYTGHYSSHICCLISFNSHTPANSPALPLHPFPPQHSAHDILL